MMAPIANDTSGPGTSADPGRGGPDQADRLRHLVHVALAVYLTPAIALVCAIGGISILVEKAARAAGRAATGRARGGPIGPRPAARPGARVGR